MYQYDAIDRTLVNERVAQFRDQTRRFLAGELSEDEFRPLRLRNGLYIQKYAPMLRVAIPYGLLSSRQLRRLAHIARTYDRDFGHFTTRQNIQYNWPKLEQVPDILAELARHKTSQVIVGFAAETENVLENARKKLASKSLDAIVVNDVSREGVGFDSDRNAVTIISHDEVVEVPETSKWEVAQRVLDHVVKLRKRNRVALR